MDHCAGCDGTQMPAGVADCEGCGHEAEIAALKAQVRTLREKYEDLIMQVAKKFPNESRHETARRYILEREREGTEGTAKQVLAATEEKS